MWLRQQTEDGSKNGQELVKFQQASTLSDSIAASNLIALAAESITGTTMVPSSTTCAFVPPDDLFYCLELRSTEDAHQDQLLSMRGSRVA